MNILLIVAIGIAVIGIVVLIVVFIAHDVLKSALGSLLAILSSLVGALVAPEVNGNASIEFHLGSWAMISGQWVKINSSRPLQLWYLPFVTVAILIVITLYFIHDASIRQPRNP